MTVNRSKLPAIQVNESRLWDSLMEIGKIGALEHGGCRRLALSDLDKEARDLFVGWCMSAGCEITIDELGNIFARRAGSDGDLSAVATGSHLDTQPHGGKFDGIYGVLAGLEVVRTLNDHDIRTRRPIDIIVWTNEEGVRFTPGLSGSAAFTGYLDPQGVMDTKSRDTGVSWRDELVRIGYSGKLKAGARPFQAFLEVHIEQGPILESDGKTIGAVTGIQGIRWFEIHVAGQDGHAGTTPLDMRQDALLASAQMVDAVHAIGIPHMPDARMTVGLLEVTPNGPSTIAGKVFFIVDMRHPDMDALEDMEREMRSSFDRIAAGTRTSVHIRPTLTIAPTPFDPSCIQGVADAAASLGYSSRPMISGAGHDAMNLARVTRTGMIFVPSRGGISHNESEYSTPQDLASGTNVLLHVMLREAELAD